MDTNRDRIARMRKAGEEARKRRALREELRAFCSGGTLVLTGLILAALYCLVTNQISV